MGKLRNVLQNNRGLSIIEVMGAVMIISVVMAGMASMSYQVHNQIARTGRRYSLSIMQRNLIAIVYDKSSWEATIQKAVTAGASGSGGSLACLELNNASPCTSDGTTTGTPLANQPLNLYDAAGTLIADSSNTDFGFYESGQPCPASEPFGTGKCYFRYDLKWSANCTSGATCTNPQIMVSGELQVSPLVKDEFNMNTSVYAVPTIYRSAH